MRLIWGLAGLAAATAVGTMSPAFADDMTFACARDATVRTVSVVDDPGHGHACEVRYAKTSEGGGPKTLWHADNSTSFCVKQAKALVERLDEAGWTCSADGASGTLAEQATPAEPTAKTVSASDAPKVSNPPEAQEANLPQPLAAPVAVGEPDPQGITAATPQTSPAADTTGGDRAPIDPSKVHGATHAPPGHDAGSFALRPTLH
jgi:hypothetical protein